MAENSNRDGLDEDKRQQLSGQIASALSICRRVLSKDPHNVGALHMMGTIAVQVGNLDQATTWLSHAVRLNPRSSLFNRDYGKVLKRLGRLEEAKQFLTKSVEADPNSAPAYLDLGTINHEMGQLDEALACYQECLNVDNATPEAHNNMGLIHQQRGELKKAGACFQNAIETKPDFALAHMNMGQVHQTAGNFQAAIKSFLEALRFDWRLTGAYTNIAYAYQLRKEYGEALAWYDRVLKIKPENAAIHINMGAVHHEMGNLARALSHYETALRLNPRSPKGYFNAGNVQSELGQPQLAVQFYRKALEIEPTYQPALLKLISHLYGQFAWDEIIVLRQRLDRLTQQSLSRNEKPVETPFMNLSRCQDQQLNFEVAAAWSRELRPTDREQPTFIRKKESDQKIHVGYLSGNFRNHPNAHLIMGLLKNHDRRSFSISCYSYGKNDGSIQRKEIKHNCEQFKDIAGLDDKRAAQCIAEAGVDILVDLMGFTEGARLKICAFRPAPLQLRYLGQAGTTGSTFFDYIIADDVVTPIKDSRYYSESLMLMPHCYQVNNYRDEQLPRSLKPKKYKAESFVFCSFNSAYKIEPSVFRAWMEILDRVPGSVLWLIGENHEFETNIRSTAATMGIDPVRIHFQPRLPRNEHLQRLSTVDISLDTWSVSGAATTADALWAGVPVIALKGAHFASRMSASILNAIGMPNLIANTMEEYIELAVDLARSPQDLCMIKKIIIKNRFSEPLFDTQRFVKNLEKAYLSIMHRYHQGLAPAAIRIGDDDVLD